MMYTVRVRTTAEKTGPVGADWQHIATLHVALRLAYGLWRERRELRHTVTITDDHGQVVYTARQLTNYFKKNITEYV